MQVVPADLEPKTDIHLLAAYIAELELEVDRLRKQDAYLRQTFADELNRAKNSVRDNTLPTSAQVLFQAVDGLSALIEDLNDPTGCQLDHDEVTAIPVRPLIEHIFRWQQRQSGAAHATLHLDLSAETINWFPLRLRHIIENLISNALKFRDPEKGEARVNVRLNHQSESIELCITDNGLGIPYEESMTASQFLNRSAFRRSPGIGVGLPVVKLLIEESGGSLEVESGEGKGACFMAVLPRYDLGDYLT